LSELLFPGDLFMPSSPSSVVRGTLAIATVAIAFGAIGTVATLFYRSGVTPYGFTAGRALAGAVVLLAILAANGGIITALRLIPRSERAGVAGIVVASSVVTICLNLAFGLMAVALVVAVYYLYPLGIAVWGSVRGVEPLTPARGFGVVLGVVGVFVVLVPQAAGSTISAGGVALACAAAIANIVVFRLMHSSCPSVTPIQLSAWMLSGNAFAAIAVALVAGQAAAALAPLIDLRLVIALIVAGVATAALPSVLLPYGIRRAGATRSSTIMFGEPTSSVLFAALILGQALTITIAAGIAAVVLGAALVNLSGRGKLSSGV
jgi:drug/metabolite transporter (DMT)-like permease